MMANDTQLDYPWILTEPGRIAQCEVNVECHWWKDWRRILLHACTYHKGTLVNTQRGTYSSLLRAEKIEAGYLVRDKKKYFSWDIRLYVCVLLMQT